MDVQFEKLSDLTQDQLRELRARADLLLQSVEGDPDEQMLHDVMQDVLRANHHKAIPFGVAKRAPHWRTFRENAEIVCTYVRDHITKNRTAMRKALGLLLRMEARWILARGLPLSQRTMAQQLCRIPDLVAREFPGYIESGLLPMIIRQRI